MRHHVYLSLGSNLGDRRKIMKEAIEALQQRVGSLAACSSMFETEPWGFESKNAFLNAAVWIRTSLTPEQVLIATQQIERDLGRTTKSKDGEYHDRLIDIDILMYDDIHLEETFDQEGQTLQLTIPHPFMHQRDFVMNPLREIFSENARQTESASKF